MKSIILALGALGGSGVLATGTVFTYPFLTKKYENKWQPIEIKLNKFDNSKDPYKGSSCFQRFFGELKIDNFNSESTTTQDSTDPSRQNFWSFFKDTTSDIYGCAVGDGRNLYELVMKNDDTGFATWYDSDNKLRKIFKFKKSGNNWQIKAGAWTKDADPITIQQIQNKTGSWSWFFMMDKATATTSGNMRGWGNDMNQPDAKAFYDTNDYKWKVPSNDQFSTYGNIPKFEKVQTLNNVCQEQESLEEKNPENKNDYKKQLEVFCLYKQ